MFHKEAGSESEADSECEVDMSHDQNANLNICPDNEKDYSGPKDYQVLNDYPEQKEYPGQKDYREPKDYPNQSEHIEHSLGSNGPNLMGEYYGQAIFKNESELNKAEKCSK